MPIRGTPPPDLAGAASGVNGNGGARSRRTGRRTAVLLPLLAIACAPDPGPAPRSPESLPAAPPADPALTAPAPADPADGSEAAARAPGDPPAGEAAAAARGPGNHRPGAAPAARAGPVGEAVAAAPGAEADPAPGRGAAAEQPAVYFVDVAAESGIDYENVSGSPEQGYILETISAGAAFLDVEGDGDQDLFLVNGTRLEDPPEAAGNHFYRHRGPGAAPLFEEATAEFGLAHTGWGMGCAVGDADNDGDPDLYVTYWGANRLYLNRGGESFAEAGRPAGVDDGGWGSSAAFGDLDGDGLLDLYVVNYVEFDLDDPPGGWLGCRYKGLSSYCGPEGIPGQADRLYRNLGGGRFAAAGDSAGISRHRLPGLGVVLSDLDADGDPDIYVANDSEANLLFRNEGGFRFREVGTAAGLAYSEDGRAQAGMGVHSGDYDGDGDFDLFVTNFSDDVNTLYANRGDGTFADATHAAGLGGVVQPFLGWSTAFLDFDNDGWLDLFVANGHVYPQLRELPSGLRYAQRNLLYRNLGGRFEEVGSEAGGDWQAEGVSRAAAVADYDDDGDPDILFVNLNDRPALLRNDGRGGNGWIGLELAAGSGDPEATGARVELWSAGRRQLREVQRGYGFQSSHDPRLLFGLGPESAVDSLVVSWPSGSRERVVPEAANRYWRLRQGEGRLQPAYAAPAPAPAAPAALRRTIAPSPPPAASPDPGGEDWSAERYRETGEDLYRRGRYAEAKAALERAIDLDPEGLGSYVNLGLVLASGLGEEEEARRVLEKAVARDPGHAGANHVLGKLYLNQGRLPEAVAALEAARRLSPGSWEYADWLGMAYLRAGRPDDAEAAFRQAARAAPWSPAPRLHLAQLYDRQGRPGESRRERRIFARLRPLQDRAELYERKVGDYPDSPHARQLLGLVYLEQARVPEALQEFEEILRLDPGFAAAHHAIGRVLQARGRLAEAVRSLERACELDPELLDAHVDLGTAYHRSGRYDLAVEAYRRALALDPERPLVYSNLGMAHAMAGRFEAAAEAFRQGLERAPDSVDLHEALGQVYARQGRLEEAVAEWEEVLRLDPGHQRAAAAIREVRRAAAGAQTQ